MSHETGHQIEKIKSTNSGTTIFTVLTNAINRKLSWGRNIVRFTIVSAARGKGRSWKSTKNNGGLFKNILTGKVVCLDSVTLEK